MELKKYDIVFHLVGEEKVPNLLGVLQLNGNKHVFIKSKDFSSSYIKCMLKDAEYDEILVKPFEINDVFNNIQAYLDRDTAKYENIAFNLTGGTKMMFTGAYLKCTDIGADAFYFDTANRRILFLNDDTSTPIKHITNVKAFLDLGQEQYLIGNFGETSLDENRIAITQKIWDNLSDAKMIKFAFDKVAKSYGENEFINGYYGKIYVKMYDTTNFKLKIDGIEYFYHNVSFPSYVDGGWFEDYIFSILKKYEEQGKIYDLHTGMIILDVKTKESIQEFDAIFTDGLNLFVMELKSGKRIDAKDINKIKTVTKHFGGRYAKPVFISMEDIKGKKNRALMDNVEYMYGRNIEQQLIEYLNKILVKK